MKRARKRKAQAAAITIPNCPGVMPTPRTRQAAPGKSGTHGGGAARPVGW
jgi:hypothetical protein